MFCSNQANYKNYFESTFFEKKLEEDANKQESELCHSKGMGSKCSAKSTDFVCLGKVCGKKWMFLFAEVSKAEINQPQQNNW